MYNNYEKILQTLNKEQWVAIAMYATKMAEAQDSPPTPNEDRAPKSKELTKDELYLNVTKIIKDIGVPAHIKGYQYFRYAVILAYCDWSYFDCVTKSLYPEIAREFHTTSSKVERAIRHAIECAFDEGEVETLHKYFTYSASRGKSTNSEAIACIVDYLKVGE